MAKDLSGSTSRTTQNIKAQIEKETNLKFKIVRIVFIVLAVFTVIKSGVGIYGHYANVQQLSLQIESEQNSFNLLKQEAEAWHKENDRTQTDVEEEGGKVVSVVTLPSAQESGIRVAALQNSFYLNGGLTVPDQEDLAALVTGGTYAGSRAWFTGDGSNQLDPAQTPLEWRFDTWYDGTPDANGIVPAQYDCVWTCWNTGESGSEYLIAVMFGAYNASSDSFSTYGLYTSNFAEILVKNGSIEASGEATSSDVEIVDGMLDELTGDGSTVSGNEVETGDDGDTANPDGDGETGSQDDGSGSNGNSAGTSDDYDPDSRTDQSDVPNNA